MNFFFFLCLPGAVATMNMSFFKIINMKEPNHDYDIHTNHTHLDTHHLKSVARKLLLSTHQRPPSARAEAQAQTLIDQITSNPKPLILDSGCGKGLSSRRLAQYYQQHWVVAIDQSAHRLQCLDEDLPANLLVIRENCIDFWPCLAPLHKHIVMHNLFYPNPWPKKKQEQRRWYAHPIMPYLCNLSPLTCIRSNWLFYLQSFAVVAEQLGHHTYIKTLDSSELGWSHFEIKYAKHHVPVYELRIMRTPSTHLT